MKRRWIGYAAWVLLALCLYFFENGTGTRAVLLCSLILPLIPLLRYAFFRPDHPAREESPRSLTVHAFIRKDSEEPGDIRLYVPGDPVRRIHWKLSAKRGELLVRDTEREPEPAEEEKTTVLPENGRKRKHAGLPAVYSAAGIVLCLILLLAVPEARRGAQALCNRIFAASEAVNSYAYQYFPVPEDQGVLAAAILLACAGVLAAVLTAVLRSRIFVLGLAAACTLFQVYFGLPFPAWMNIPLYALAGLLMMKRPREPGHIRAYCALILLVSALTALLLPGADAALEAASEHIRDKLAGAAGLVTDTITESPDGETETRHMHSRDPEYGIGEAETAQEFRLVTEEEQQISRPRWISWMRIVLMMLLAVAVMTLPFTPFLLLNARRRKAQEIRKTFVSGNVSEAVIYIFRQAGLWLEASGRGGGNLLYRDWTGRLKECMPEGYAEHFARCAADYEEAVYSCHAMPERKRQDALELLKETEAAVWGSADRKQRLYLKYWMCLCE